MCVREREIERERDRERERQRQRQRDRESERNRKTEKVINKHSNTGFAIASYVVKYTFQSNTGIHNGRQCQQRNSFKNNTSHID